MRITLYQPDIPQNTGTILRMAACLQLPVDIIGPSGFDPSDRALHRAGLDCLDHVSLSRHKSWAAFMEWRRNSCASARLILLTTKGEVPHISCDFLPDDTLLFGRESAGVPDHVHTTADLRLRIPIAPGLRSLNVAVAAALIVGIALGQTSGWPRA